MSTANSEPKNDIDIVAQRKSIVRRRVPIGRWLGRLALVGYLFSLWWYRDLLLQYMPSTTDVVWNLSTRAAIWESLKQFAVAAAALAGLYFVIGFLVLMAAGKPRTPRSSFRRKLAILFVGMGLTTVVRGVELGQMPGSAQMAIPLLGALTGMIIGSASLRGKKGIISLCVWSMTHLLLFVIFLGVVAYLATDAEPLETNSVGITSAEKRRITKLIQRSTQNGEDDVHRLVLRESDVKSLAAWGLELAGADPNVNLRLDDGKITAQSTQTISIPQFPKRYVNMQTTWRIGIDEGRPRLQIDQLQVGRIGLPRFLCNSLSRGVLSLLKQDDEIWKIVGSFKKLEVADAKVILEGDRETIREEVLPSLQAKLGVSPELVSATGDYLNHLVEDADRWPQGDQRMVAAMTSAFQLAQSRSAAGDPLLENRAALLSLGILLGHHRVADLSGSRDATRHLAAAKDRIGHVTMRGRSDWTKHFCVSAALVVLSDNSTSDLLGVLKEDLDSDGGSGFSFGDLLADRAGAQFSKAALDDVDAARRMQNAFAEEVTLEDFFPTAAGLPEGLSANELQTRYGGIGGAGYRKLEAEIERRLRECPLLSN